MKKIILLIFVFLATHSAQESSDNYNAALKAYSIHEYGTAYQIFKKDINEGNLLEPKLSSAQFYAADCLLELNELDGAASELELFIDKYKSSSFRETALYKLGTAYYEKGEYRKARERLNLLIFEYPFSQFLGSAYYWIGESNFAEGKYVDAEDNFLKAIEREKTNKFFVNTLYSLAQVYERTNDYKKAVAQYDELLAYYKEDPLAPKSQMRIGICYFNQKDYDNAILELTDPLMKKLPPKELNDAKYFLANSYVRLKEYKEASVIYNELLNVTNEPVYVEKIKYSLAWLNFQQNEYESAFKIFQDLAVNSSDSLRAVSLYWSGECKRYLGQEKEASDIFKSFISKYPTHNFVSRAQLNIGAVNLNQVNNTEGEKALLNATMSDNISTRGKAYTFLGELRLNKKNYDDAKKYFSEAVKLTNGDKELNNRALLGLAVADFYLNDYKGTASNLETLKTNAKNFETDKVNFYLAETYFVQGKYSAALKSYNMVSNSKEDLGRQTLLGKAYSYFNLKDFPNSTFYFNEYINKYSNDQSINEIRLRLADSYFGTKNFAKASSIYRELFSKEKFLLDNDAAYYQYGQSLFKSGKTKEAINAFENLQEKFPRSQYVAESQYVIGWIYFQENDFNSALINYQKVIQKYPRSNLKPVAYYSIGDCYFNSGSYDSSIVYYSKVLNEFPSSQYVFDAVNGIQYAYIAKEEPERAVDFIDQFISSNPNSKFGDQIYFKKGDLYYSLQKYDQAINSYKEFISKYPGSNLIPNAYYWIGKSAANKKDNNEAINNFTTAKQKASKSETGISSTIEIANIYAANKQYSAAANILKEMIDAVPTSNRVPELLFLLGINLVNGNQLDAAASAFDQIINYYEGTIFSAKAKVEFGKIELKKNNYESAQTYLKEIGEKRLDDIGAEAQYYYGVLLFNQNKIEDAITALVRVRSVFSVYDEWHTKALLMLGDCYLKMNDKKQAREMYRAVLSKHPSGEFSTEAKKKIKEL